MSLAPEAVQPFLDEVGVVTELRDGRDGASGTTPAWFDTSDLDEITGAVSTIGDTGRGANVTVDVSGEVSHVVYLHAFDT